MKIKDVKVATAQEWDEMLLACSYSTYFHSREWAEIWQKYSAGSNTPYPLLITFHDNTKVLIPLSTNTDDRNGYLKKYISSPAGTYGGWISSNKLSGSYINAITEYLYSISDSLVLRINPYDEIASSILYKDCKPDFTNTLKLNPDFQAIYKSWTKGHKSAVTKAINNGVTISKAQDLNDWKKYFEIYQSSIRRWGKKATSNYGWSLFEELYNRKSSSIILWLANYEEKPIAGALCLYKNEHVVYWHGAASDDFFNLRPANLLMYEAIKDACQRGYHWFDFNPSGGHEGVRSFKRSFGTIELNTPVIRHRSLKLRVFNSLKHRYNTYRKKFKTKVIEGTKRGIMSRAERILIRVRKNEIKYPPIFVVGTLRSGTTIIYQYLNFYYKFSYFPNKARGRNSSYPFLSTYLSGCYKKFTPTFESKYGDIEGDSSPSDGWEIFHRWFSYYMNPQKTNFKKINELVELVGVFESLYNAPFVNKNNSNTLRIIELSRLFPEALFINVKRNIYDTVASVFEGRKRNKVATDTFWSVAPDPELLDVDLENEMDLVVFQYLFNNCFVEEVEKRGLIKNLININYEDFCLDQTTLIQAIEEKYDNRLLIKRNADLSRSPIQRVSKVNSLKNEIDPIIEKHYNKVRELVDKIFVCYNK